MKRKDIASVFGNVTSLSAHQLDKVRRALHPRDAMLSLRFSREDIESWRKAAKKAGKTLTDWILNILNHEASK